MATTINRRDFIKYAGGGIATVVVGSRLGWLLNNPLYVAAATQTLDFHISDTLKEMITHLPSSLNLPNLGAGVNSAPNDARCYFWVYKSVSPDLPHDCPGPIIVAAKGDVINISVTNDLDEPHTLACPSLGISTALGTAPTINPGGTATVSITASIPGSHLYFDDLNAPVNRMMGLHGALIVMPTEADRIPGHKLTPYSNASAQLPVDHGVQRLYDDFGSAHYPGLAWEEGDSSTWALYDPNIDGGTPVVNCPPFRQYVWIDHQASPKLFAEVGSLAAGQLYDPNQFVENFLRGPFAVNNSSIAAEADRSYTPQYFTINGQSGMLSHFSPTVTMMGRVGEPCVVHILNAGLWIHSMHLHANHFYVTLIDGIVQENPIWLDVMEVRPMERIDYTVPFMRPPDLSFSQRSIGFPDTPATTLANPAIPGSVTHPAWPCTEEFDTHLPSVNPRPAFALDGVTPINLAQRMSPLCYPMHDHSEPSQTSQGGNYNMGLIAGIYFTGDRNGTMDFPMDEDFHMAFQNVRGTSVTGLAAPPLGT